MIIRWPKHIKAICNCDRTNDYCNGCRAFTCRVCGGSEGELPTQCPGDRMTRNQRLDVLYGRADYTIAGGWTVTDGLKIRD